MSERARTNTMLITSIVLAIVSMILMGVMKHSLQKIPFIDRLLQLKNLGVDSMKDFLEVSELNLRVAEHQSHPEDRTIIEWDSDESKSYLIFVSSEYIPKIKLLHSDSIPNFHNRELVELRQSSNWTRKILVKGHDKHVKIIDYVLKLTKFNCRVRSDYGRISRHLAYPINGKSKLVKAEIDAWLLTKGSNCHLCIAEATPGSIIEYSAMVYVKDGTGLKFKIPPFRDFIDFNLGAIPPGLVYLTGVRRVGVSFEQFVGWFGQEKVLYEDDELKSYLPADASWTVGLNSSESKVEASGTTP